MRLEDPERGEGRTWVVVGGGDTGGIIVRRGQALDSSRLDVRLTPGTRIEEVELKNNRIHYKRLAGDGPDWGWVSIAHKGKPLVQLEEEQDVADERPAHEDGHSTWRVVGGRQTGGVLVREGPSRTSAPVGGHGDAPAPYCGRLMTGALVRQVRLEGVHLEYRLLQGVGPTGGWVSIETPGRRDLLVPATGDLQPMPRPCVPDHGSGWDSRERSLFVDSGGIFDPAAMLAKRPGAAQAAAAGDSVSAVVPTTESRRGFHRRLWACFAAQTWPDKELVVVETYLSEPSAFFAEKSREDPRVLYVPIRILPGRDLSIGLKRNMCTHLARGDYIANFDDDDLYSPQYVARMMWAMSAQRCEAITLRSWYVFDCKTGRTGHVDPHELYGKTDPALEDQWVLGYGFSYVFSRSASLMIPFTNIDLGEDWKFFDAIRRRATVRSSCSDAIRIASRCGQGALSPAAKAPRGIALLEDNCGICLHVLHARNTSQSWASRAVPDAEVDLLEVAELGDPYIALKEEFPATRRTSAVCPRERACSRFWLVNSKFGCVHVGAPVGTTAGEVAQKVGTMLGKPGGTARRVKIMYSPQGPPLPDQEPIRLRTTTLWAIED